MKGLAAPDQCEPLRAPWFKLGGSAQAQKRSTEPSYRVLNTPEHGEFSAQTPVCSCMESAQWPPGHMGELGAANR